MLAAAALHVPTEYGSAYEAQLVGQVVDSLSMHMMDNARFMAERLFAEFPSENNAYLLGTCHYWCDKAYSAYDVLRGCTMPHSRYMFALSCLKLGKYTEAEKALEGHGLEIPNGAYGHFLLGNVSKLQNRHDKAIEHYRKALTLNPMMWSAYEELCNLGDCEVADSIQRSSSAAPGLTAARSGGTEEALTECGMMLDSEPAEAPADRGHASRPMQDGAARRAAHRALSAADVRPQGAEAGRPGEAREGALSASLPARAGLDSPEGQAAVVALLRAIGKGHRLLALYKAAEAVDAFAELPCQHYQTAWVLSQVGRAYFEMIDYSKACHFFTWSRNQDPYRLEGLEWYSTVLWHMKREVELSHLAQDALSLDRLCPQAWCVMGNCFSLQKEHETALRFFQRALQLDPHFTYAYTLCGHEYFANEDFDKSLAFYRNAITRDPRHYNAWYGIGQIYYRQEKYDLAINNFKHALSINPRSSVLTCYLGMACHKQNYIAEALAWLKLAIQADEQNPLARFEHASVLIGQEKYHEAIAELEKLKDVAPREASVYFQTGRIYKKLNMPDKALTDFCYAMDLKPSSIDQNLIKSAIEKLHVGDEDVDEEI